MDLLESNTSRLNFEAYINQLVSVIGHADRVEPLHDDCTGLLLPGERKSVEPMAALTAPARTAPNHHASLPIAHRLYLPETWADDAERRTKAKVLQDGVFKTKPRGIALDQLRATNVAGIPLGTVLADAGYG
jgi:SRSO17 transposase